MQRGEERGEHDRAHHATEHSSLDPFHASVYRRFPNKDALMRAVDDFFVGS